MFFVFPIRSHPIYAIFRSCSRCPHQNFPFIAFISLMSAFGIWNTFIIYVGIAWITALSRISLPACDRNFSFHPLILFQIRPLMLLKELIRDLPIKGRRPRYFSYQFVALTPISIRIVCLVSSLVFQLKKNQGLLSVNFLSRGFLITN
jgi:hypothetical protein